MLNDERKIGIVVTSNGNRIMGLLRRESDAVISIYRPIVIVRGDFNKTKAEGDIVLANFDSMIGLNIIDQIETMYVTNPAFYAFFEKEIKSYQNFHATSYDNIKKAFSERYAQAKASGNLDPKDQVNNGVADFQTSNDENKQEQESNHEQTIDITPKNKDCGCKGKQAVQKLVNQFKSKFSDAKEEV